MTMDSIRLLIKFKKTFQPSVGAGVDDDGGGGLYGRPRACSSCADIGEQCPILPTQRTGGHKGPHPISTPPPPLRITSYIAFSVVVLLALFLTACNKIGR